MLILLILDPDAVDCLILDPEVEPAIILLASDTVDAIGIFHEPIFDMPVIVGWFADAE